ncbi:hypothetical protein [Xanthobacter aminoxidans]|uniref:hypothetical protein n=1 Tax=Xanthobacter aminoxidans TaxID=186280 RepID=UPI00202302A8|nr:hypothetical protein [Xanthobacter aminoxidans]MCL8385591.1 hypothetical protein [Xanthobacter aminoxidans]
MVFSPQQVKFEFLSYIKEFGGRPADWCVGCADDPARALFVRHAVDTERDIWLWKPTLSPAAARIVFRYLTEQLHVPAVAEETGRCIFLFRRGPVERPIRTPARTGKEVDHAAD